MICYFETGGSKELYFSFIFFGICVYLIVTVVERHRGNMGQEREVMT